MTSAGGSTYIPYIDGMRALAVIAVMLYHLWPAAVPGGFVGVDVFFVISGFVVTASLAPHGSETLGRFLGGFYARRLSRLIPALVLMLVATTLAYVLLVPKAWFTRAAETVGQAAFWGLSNWVLHARTVNYFEPGAEWNPFTHTWSLGLEEQFYLIAPLLLFLALRKDHAHRHRYLIAAVVAALSLLSFLACYWVGVTQGGRAVFYHPAFRFWELAAGVLLFLLLPAARRLSVRLGTGGRVSGVAGLLLILVAVLAPQSSAWPFLRATVAVFGALLLISSAHANPRDGVRLVLASCPLLWIGRRSYSLYLWHWPVYVLARWTVGLAEWPTSLVAVGLSFVLAAASYRFVEKPFRSSERLRARPLRQRIGICLAMMAAGWGIGHVLLSNQPQLGLGKVTRESADWYRDAGLLKRVRGSMRACDPAVEPLNQGVNGTRFDPKGCHAKKRSQLFVLGDSHAMALEPLLEQLSAEEGRRITLITTPGCGYLDLLDAMEESVNPACYRGSRAALEWIVEQSHPGDIVFLPSLRLPRLVFLGGERRSVPTDQDAAAGELLALTDAERAGLGRAVADAPRWIEPLVGRGLHVVFEAPLPIFRSHPFACVEWWNRGNPECAPGLDQRRDDLEQFRQPVMDALSDLTARYPGASLWDPMDTLCTDTLCSAMWDGRPLFFDADHLSPYGNLVLFEPFQAMIRGLDGHRVVR